MPTEAAVSRLIRERFTFRVVAVAARPLRNELEERLIATLAACPTCGPSPAWLGRFAYGASMRQSGLWNTKSVGGPTLTSDQLAQFAELAATTGQVEPSSRRPATPFARRRRCPGIGPEGDPTRTLVVIPCSWGKERGSDERGSGPAIAEYLFEDLAQRLSDARTSVSVLAGVDHTRMPAWRRYGRGLLYRAAGTSLEEALSTGRTSSF